MLKLKRLKIDQFRNVAPGTELHFRDSFNVLLGKNGTGKTTLLNLIVSVLSWNFELLLGEPFAIEYDLEIPGGKAKVRLSNKLLREVGPDASEAQAGAQNLFERALLSAGERYENSGEIVLSGERLTQARVIAFEGSTLRLRNPNGAPVMEWSALEPISGAHTLMNIWHTLQYKRPRKSSDQALADMLMSFGVSKLRRFDESLGFLNHITRAERAFRARWIDHKPLVNALDGGPYVVIQEIERQIEKTSDVDEVRVDSDQADAEFLDRVVQLLGAKYAKLRLQRIAHRTEPYERIDFGNMRFDLTRQDRSIINHTLLSYGQKRLLSFYYYLACSPECVVADELVNGMHHEWIEACLEDLGERQAFLTSQNPLLLDYLGFESAEEVLSSFVICRSELQGERESLRWENMTAEDAEGFFGAYQVGVQHVSEILRVRGLW